MRTQGGIIMFVGILFIALGFVMLYFSITNKAYNQRNAIATSCYFLIFGIAVAYASYVNNNQLLLFVMCFGLGFIFIFVGLWNVKKSVLYKNKVDATYVGSTYTSGRLYSPMFQYHFNGKKYKQSEGKTYRQSFIERQFIMNNVYPIYVSSKNPAYFTISRKVRSYDIITILFGIAICSIPFIL